MERILIIEKDVPSAEYFKRLIEIILPDSEVDLALTLEVATTLQKEKDFSVIVLDSQAALNLVPKEQFKNVIVCSYDHEFVHEAIKECKTNIILRTADFYEGMSMFFSSRKII